MRKTFTKVFCDPCLANSIEEEGEEFKLQIDDAKATIGLCTVHEKELAAPIREAIQQFSPVGTTAAGKKVKKGGSKEKCPVCNGEFINLGTHRSRAGH